MRQDLPKQLQAVQGEDIPTFRVIGVVGSDFRGGDLAAAVQNFDEGNGVRLILDTPGGDASEAFHFYDYVRTNALKVYVDGFGKVMSAGTIIMAAAGRARSRLAPNAEYMVHNASGGDEGRRVDANRKMANIYADLTGKQAKTMQAMMDKETFMSAQQAKEAGFVGAIIEHQRLAAQLNDMEKETVKDKRSFDVTTAQALKAVATNKIELEFDLDKEVAGIIEGLTKETKDLSAKLTEVQDEVKAKNDAVTAAADKLTAQEVKTTEEAAKVTALTTERDALKAEVEKLKTTPLAPAVKGAGTDVVTPGKGEETPEPFKKLTAEERRAGFAKLSSLNPTV